MTGVNIFFLPTLVMEDSQNFQRNTHAHNLHTTCKYYLHIENANLTKHQGGVYHTVMNLLRDYLLTQAIYYVDGSTSIEKI